MTQTIWECFRPAFRERTWVYIYYKFVYISSVLKIILSFYVVVFDCFRCLEDMSPIRLKLKFLLIPLYIFCYLIFFMIFSSFHILHVVLWGAYFMIPFLRFLFISISSLYLLPALRCTCVQQRWVFIWSSVFLTLEV